MNAPYRDRRWWLLTVAEFALWTLALMFIVFGGIWWHVSGAGAAALAVRATRAGQLHRDGANRSTNRGPLS